MNADPTTGHEKPPHDHHRPPTPRQLLVLRRVQNLSLLAGEPPTVRELAKSLGVSVGGVQRLLDALVRKGCLERSGERRSLQVTRHGGRELLAKQPKKGRKL